MKTVKTVKLLNFSISITGFTISHYYNVIPYSKSFGDGTLISNNIKRCSQFVQFEFVQIQTFHNINIRIFFLFYI